MLMPRECKACLFSEWTSYASAEGTETGAFCYHPKLRQGSRVEARMVARVLGPDLPDWCPKERGLEPGRNDAELLDAALEVVRFYENAPCLQSERGGDALKKLAELVKAREKPRAWLQGEDGKFRCSHCGEERVLMRFPGGTRDEAIDPCLVLLVNALNDAEIPTAATCCGHGGGMGNIWLDDGRVLAVFADWDAYLAVWDMAIERGLVEPRQF